MRSNASIPLPKTALPPTFLPIAFVALLLFGIGENVLLAFFSLVVLLIGTAMLWRPGEAPILLFIFGHQWLQASARIFQANTKGVAVDQLSYPGGHVALAIVLSLISLLALAAGLRIGAGPWRSQDGQWCRTVGLSQSLSVWFRLYALAWVVALICVTLARLIPGLSQPFLAAAALKWSFFWILAYATFISQKGNKKYLLFAFGFELLMGLGTYFSDFKTVFIISILALIASGTRFSGKKLLVIAVLSGMLLFLGVVWTAVKVDFRVFVSGGEKAQVVVGDFSTRLAGLAELVSKVDSSDLSKAVDGIVNRIGYVDFFAVVLDRVPEAISHENGAIWWDAITRPFMPRILFPWKTAINDSERTNQYTGLGVASYDSGTSISIGYIGESYIDFGSFGMMLTIFLYGLFLGRCYKWFIQGINARGLLGMALITAVLMHIAALETSITKAVGGVLVSMLVSLLFVRFVVPSYLPWLRINGYR